MSQPDLLPDFEMDGNKNKSAKSKTKIDAKEKPDNEVWVNIGLVMPVPQADGTMKETFVGFPWGVAMDAMRDALPRIPDPQTANPEYYNRVIAQHMLLDWFEGEAKKLGQGERAAIPLNCQVYRRKQEVTLADALKSGSNPMANLLKGLGITKEAKPTSKPQEQATTSTESTGQATATT